MKKKLTLNNIKRWITIYFLWMYNPLKYLYFKRIKKINEDDSLYYNMTYRPVNSDSGTWIIGADIILVFQCKITNVVSITKKTVKFSNDNAIYASKSIADEFVQEALHASVIESIDLKRECKEARKTINIQNNIEGGIIFLISVSAIALSIIAWMVL